MVLQDHRVRATSCSTTSTSCPAGPSASRRCRRTGSAAARAPRSTSRSATRRASPPTRRSPSSRRGPTRCSAARSSCSRRSTRSWRELVAGTEYEADVDARRQAAAARETAVERAAGRAREARRVHRPLRRQPGQRREGARSGSRDYVLMEYGTGAVMAVPCGDQRDFEFARKYGLPIPPVVVAEDDPLLGELAGVARARARTTSPWDEAYDGAGVMVQSGEFTGMRGGKDSRGHARGHRVARRARARAASSINFRLRDWLISPPALLGQPDPGGPLPDVRARAGARGRAAGRAADGRRHHARARRSPTTPSSTRRRARSAAAPPGARPTRWTRSRARRGTTCATRDARNDAALWARATTPTTGCRSTSTSAASSTRSCTCSTRASSRRCFRDMGLLGCDEPFTNLLTQGMVKLDGATMSKSQGQRRRARGHDRAATAPTRCAPTSCSWRRPRRTSTGATRASRACSASSARVWRLVGEIAEEAARRLRRRRRGRRRDARRCAARCTASIGKVDDDIERFQFNTALSAMMELVNAAYDYRRDGRRGRARPARCSARSPRRSTLLLAPFAPHMAEELWRVVLGARRARCTAQAWPAFDPSAAAAEEVELAVQVNGKVRGKVTVAADARRGGRHRGCARPRSPPTSRARTSRRSSSCRASS